MSTQAPKPPDPFDPVDEERRESPSLNEVVQEALESFRHLNEGGAAPHVVVEIDGEHMSARWEKPKR